MKKYLNRIYTILLVYPLCSFMCFTNTGRDIIEYRYSDKICDYIYSIWLGNGI